MLKKLAADFSQANATMTKEIVGKIESVQKEVAVVKKEIIVIDKKVDDHEKRIKALEGGGSSGGTSKGAFSPNFLEVKGYCTWEDKNTKGVSGNTIRNFVKAFKDSLNEEQRGWVGAPEVRGSKMYKSISGK